MSEPYWCPDLDKYSNCCGAISDVEIVDNLGMCAKCKEWADFKNEDESETKKKEK